MKRITRKETNNNYYQKHRETLRERARNKWHEKKKIEKENKEKYYGAESIRVLLSLKNYTELSQQKYKLWADFCWTLKANSEEISSIVCVMKLRESAERLISDYWKSAKSEVSKGKSWNSLSEEQQSKLIKYWGYEKARKEKELDQTLTELEERGESYEKAIELAKFHEERGKVGCDCWSCAENRQLLNEVKQAKEEYWKEEKPTKHKEECPWCGEWKKLNDESGLCRGCVETI
jgi:hypothetical protein